MKLTLLAALATVALAGTAMQARACNPLLNPNYGKHVSPTLLPAAMLAKNNPHAASHSGIVGLWHDVHTANDGSQFLEGFETWNRDGTENELGHLPPAGGNLCVGTWTRNGRTINLTAHVAWVYDLNNNYVGTLDFTEANKVSMDGNSYTGTFDARFFDPSGNQYLEVVGTTAADRLGQ